ncbi:hypothetical protein P9386_03850 [Caldifermentibacillus hisashii]|uniref:hypothetical protein n=1 Tax=Bacillaceae TaxID=186817 RepID=UPI002E1D46E7|nr:hypothetical protein [Caldifermentibacillus hisashii]
MNKHIQQYCYSDDETLMKAIELIKNGRTEEEVQEKFNLSDDDMSLIDFVINEF